MKLQEVEELTKQILALDKWFESQNIEDSMAPIIMAELVALNIARNFSPSSAPKMIEAFKRLFDASMKKYLQTEDCDDKKRTH